LEKYFNFLFGGHPPPPLYKGYADADRGCIRPFLFISLFSFLREIEKLKHLTFNQFFILYPFADRGCVRPSFFISLFSFFREIKTLKNSFILYSSSSSASTFTPSTKRPTIVCSV
jgi:hypothetical protein